ncbi:MAG: cation:proton antiporter [Legionellales bacterium]|nr:cation:proton antiporter [Legionellales bacterium]
MAHTEKILFIMFVIFSGTALLSTVALFTRQSLLVAYMVLGALCGSWGLMLVTDPELIMQIGEIGIMFLLFLLGLHLQPQNLVQMLSKVTWVALISSLVFVFIGYGVSVYFGFTNIEGIVIGVALMFSSTIIGLKLLPTTILHHQHTGEVMISVLLMQDILAIVVLLLLHGAQDGFSYVDTLLVIVSLPALITIAFLVERYVLLWLFTKFDQIQEYVFILSIGWCLGLSNLSGYLGLSEEIGAFIAGVSLASSPIALYIAESLKPLRDFFLVMFFFSIGAGFNFDFLHIVLLPAIILSVILLVVKPLAYTFLLRRIGETKQVSNEVGLRLGQASEFSLLVSSLATGFAIIGEIANYLVQATTIITFIVSSYIVVFCYPTPMAMTEKMRQD